MGLMRTIMGAIVVASICLLSMTSRVSAEEGKQQPNVILIYADDLGYGDLSCYGATAVSTPNIDRIAKEGIRFTDAHSAAATCTPSRFAMMTGFYAWRKKGTGIAAGDAAALIRPGTITMATIFGDAGYKSSVIGKWHLGLGDGKVDWNGRIAPGPLQIGFDECFLVPATGDRVPTVYVENDRVFKLDPSDPLTVNYKQPIGDEPTGAKNPELLTMKLTHGHDNSIHNGISRIGFQSGGKAARWNDQEMADTLTQRACDFIERQASAKQPFFLFYSLHDIHVPRTPHPRFVGKTSMGPRGDAIVQTDWAVGEVLAKLDTLDIAENTLVIFTSDNGPVLDDGYLDGAVSKRGLHDPAGGFRGGKYSAFEAGTRVPMVARWPKLMKPGQVSDALMSQVDFCACFASITGITLRPNECFDSREQVPALLGNDDRGRWFLVEQGNTLGLRHGNWKYIEPSGGPAFYKPTGIESGLNGMPQLYDLDKDPQERVNVAAKFPKKVAELKEIMKGIRKEGEEAAGAL
jgi:arylsulfatase A-like enzyme